MSKRLMLMRHGKSSWEGAADDISRPLAPRGERAARDTARFLSAAGADPEVVVSSPAERARATAERAAAAAGWPTPRSLESLYGATVPTLLDEVRALDDAVASALFVGHEPTMSAAVRALTGARVAMVTGAVVVIDSPSDTWRAFEPASGQLVLFLPPRALEDGGLDRG